MNDLVLQMKEKRRAMKSYVLLIFELVFESLPENVLEIGVGSTAQSTKTILSALQENDKGKLISIDSQNRDIGIDNNLQKYWKLIVGDSHDIKIFNEVKKISPIYDLLLIDGDHTYEGVKKDFEMYVPLVKKNGIILMHDITNVGCGVPKFWKEIKYPKISLEYGKAGRNIVPGFGIVQIK